jgi:hypothetical protein
VSRAKGRTCRRSGWLAILVATDAIALAACGGGSSSPLIASLSKTSASASADRTVSVVTTRPKGNPTALLDKWATCMQAHGDPGQAAPTIDANKVIHLTWNDATAGGIYGTNKGGQGNAGPGQYCRTYIDEAENELQSSQDRQQPSQVQLLKFSQCMRANGVPDFPDPRNGGLSFNRAGDLNPSNPTFQNASRSCAKKNDVPGLSGPQPGSVVFNGDGTGGAGG